MNELGKFADRFASWREMLGSISDDGARVEVFAEAAHDVAGYVSNGLSRAVVADELHDIASAYLIAYEPDLVQAIVSDAFAGIKANGHAEPIAKRKVKLMPESQFIGGFVGPSFLIEGMLQRGFIYSLTGATSHAKSAIALALSELVASPDRNAMFGKHHVEKGRVVYFVGENPDDIKMRVIGANSLRTDPTPELDERYFFEGRIEIEKEFEDIRAAMTAVGNFDLVIVDTSAAYFLGDEELSNTQMGGHARMLRRLTELPGNPCVLVLCHPVKHPQDWTQLLPRGGGAFLAEMDGNLTAWKHDEVMIDLNYTKMRGPGFEPMTLKLETIRTPRLVDSKDRLLPTVRAIVASASDVDQQERKTVNDGDRVLMQMMYAPDQSYSDIARALGWLNSADEPAKMRVQRLVEALSTEKPAIVRKTRGRWLLTDKGKEMAAAAVRTEAQNVPVQEAML